MESDPSFSEGEIRNRSDFYSGSYLDADVSRGSERDNEDPALQPFIKATGCMQGTWKGPGKSYQALALILEHRDSLDWGGGKLFIKILRLKT